METTLLNALTEFLMSLPVLHNEQGRRALVLSAGLDDLLPYLPLSGSTYGFVAPLLHHLDQYGTFPDGTPAVIRLLTQVMELVGEDRQQTLREFCDQYRPDATPFPSAVSGENAGRTITTLRDYVGHIGDQAFMVTGDHATINYYTVAQNALSAEERARQAALQRSYLERVRTLSNQLPLTGIDRKAVGTDSESCLNLGAIYTALLTHSSDMSGRNLAQHATLPTESGNVLSALDQLNRHTHFVLLGDPGSGKSTFVKFVSMCLAGELLGDECVNLARLTAPLPKEKEDDDASAPQTLAPQTLAPQAWDCGPLLPVLVVLRDFAARGLPPEGQPATVQHLWEFLERELQNVTLGEYAPLLESHLREQGGLILLDGLDEVPEAAQHRVQIKQAIEDFAATFQKCRIIVTSRTYAYQRQEWRLTGFQEAVLASFTDGQIRAFVDRWYRHLAEIRGQDLDDAQGRSEVLKYAIFQYERLHNLAVRPLLLTLMASLHAWRGGSLPERREELYSDTVELLLDWWERPKIVRDASGQILVSQESLAELLNVGKETVREVLNTLAFQVHKEQAELVGTADIAQKDLVEALMQASQNKDLRPAWLIEYLRDRAGLLVPRGVGIYAFPHRTFQEYLAACYLTDEDYPELVADLARQEPNRWREVLLLAGAKAASGTASAIWNLAEELCFQEVNDEEVTADDAWGALLAGQALSETANLERVSPRNRKKLARICQWLTAILTEQQPADSPFPATERALAGNILAHLGDLRPGVGLREDGLPDIAWCEVPEGQFLMGSELTYIEAEWAKIELWANKLNWNDETKRLYKRLFFSEHPQHSVDLSPYFISRYPITNAQYRAFVEDGGYTHQTYWTDEGWAWKESEHITGPEPYSDTRFQERNHPVVGVSWYEAIAFCAWLTARLRNTGELSPTQQICLPTEAQWEKAARGPDGRIYPWGNDTITPQHANYCDTQIGATSAAGCFPQRKSPYGCDDMSGNVWEWCWDWFDEHSYQNSPRENPRGPDTASSRVYRGGSWGTIPVACRSAIRAHGDPADRENSHGFRLLRGAPFNGT